jgi:endonuclease YncB( thermonuclease family)
VVRPVLPTRWVVAAKCVCLMTEQASVPRRKTMDRLEQICGMEPDLEETMAGLAGVLICLVIGISDGDTLTARCDTPAGLQALKVRLAEIDAPERRQAFGTRSRQHLASLCFRKQAEVGPTAMDRYRRMVARVQCNGIDASAEQVRAGMAWAFTRYLRDPAIASLEKEAREERRGLWVDASPVPPWVWREQRRLASPVP